MRREQMRNAIDLDALLKEFASSPQATAIRRAMKQPCPEPAAVAAFCQGKWDEQREQEFRRHLLGCPTCAALVAQQRHPSEELLLCYVSNLIPTGPAGTLLRDRLAWHLQACAPCHMQVEQVTLEILQWTTLQQTLERIGWVQQLVSALASAAQVVPRSTAARGGARAALGIGEEVTALVFDKAGQLLVDAQGEPHTVRFEVLDAKIDRQRGLLVQLLTEEQAYCLPEKPVATVQVALHHHAQRLCFPPVPIRRGPRGTPRVSGVATLRAQLAVEMALDVIPTEAIRVTVQLSGDTKGERTHGDVSSLQR